MIWHCVIQTLIFYPTTKCVHHGEGITFLPVFFLNQETALIVMVGAVSVSCQGTERGVGGSIYCHSNYLAVTNKHCLKVSI